MTTNYLYINNIDKCVDNVFDTFYQELLNNLKLKKNIINIDYIFNNFNSILESINNILLNSVNIFKLKDFLHTDYDIVIEIIHKYTLLYIFFNLIVSRIKSK